MHPSENPSFKHHSQCIPSSFICPFCLLWIESWLRLLLKYSDRLEVGNLPVGNTLVCFHADKTKHTCVPHNMQTYMWKYAVSYDPCAYSFHLVCQVCYCSRISSQMRLTESEEREFTSLKWTTNRPRENEFAMFVWASVCGHVHKRLCLRACQPIHRFDSGVRSQGPLANSLFLASEWNTGPVVKGTAFHRAHITNTHPHTHVPLLHTHSIHTVLLCPGC